MEFNIKLLNQIFKLIDELYFNYYSRDDKISFGRIKGLCDCYRSLNGNDKYLLSVKKDNDEYIDDDDDDEECD